MKTIRKSYKRDLTKTQELKLLSFFQAQFDELDQFLVELKEQIPELMFDLEEKYIQVLLENLDATMGVSVYASHLFKSDRWNYLNLDSSIINALQQKLLTILEIQNTPLQNQVSLLENDSVVVPFLNYVRSGYYHVYYLFYSLQLIKGKEFTHSIAKKIAEVFFTLSATKRKYYENLEAFLNFISDNCVPTHDYSLVDLEDGRMIFYVDNCLWGEALKDVEDPDLISYFMCYGDFFSTRGHNENFRLTREKTVCQKQGICDFCYHDLRLNSQLEHPSTEFWESLQRSR